MVKVGILADRSHLNKLGTFIEELSSRARVKIWIAEEILVDFNKKSWDVDVILVKTKDHVALSALETLERSKIPVVNPTKTIFLIDNRFILNSFLARAGIPQPNFAICCNNHNPFECTITKDPGIESEHDKKVKIHIGKEINDKIYAAYRYCQEFTEPEKEYKIYTFGKRVLIYHTDPPIIYNPEYHNNKLYFRKRVNEPEVEIFALNVVTATHAKMSSMDIIQNEKGELLLVDLNSRPGLQEPHVRTALADYLLEVGQ